HWVILFEYVKPGEDYVLEVRDYEGVAAVQTGIKVKKGKGKEGAGTEVEDERQITIIYPGNDAKICNNFVAYGTTDHPMANVTGMIIPPSGPAIIGSTIQQPTSDGTWAIQFTGVPDGENYKLEVTNTAGDYAHSDRITVNSSFCM